MSHRRELRPDAPGHPAPATPAPAAVDKSEPAKSNNERWDDDEEPWRHAPVAPADESAAESLGRSISDLVIGSADAARKKPGP